jgi:NAD(P)-dependent dehydrogenase (short-subunit alcohol dehydrogenase family)
MSIAWRRRWPRSSASTGSSAYCSTTPGVYHPESDFLDVPPEQFDATLAVNLRVPFFASQGVAKRLIAEGQTAGPSSTRRRPPGSAAARSWNMARRRRR